MELRFGVVMTRRVIEIFHCNFLPSLLKTFKFTPNCMLYGETGSNNMSTKIDIRMVYFWLKLKFGNQRKISSIVCALISKLHTKKTDTFHFKWVDTVKSALNHTGFSSIWEAHEIDTVKFKACFSQRRKDIFQQQWHEEVSKNSQCAIYWKFKEPFNMENYLSNHEDCHKFNVTRFRTRTNHLPITKQHLHDDSADISCPLCSVNETGDEYPNIFPPVSKHYQMHAN